uniref:Uncharacterized protein n=1 Tax=Kibale red colobus virus 1 TaxID=1885929 RepID=X2D791_9NIDO|nr:hypothetical protein [Kibale red colobus virus 1]
MLAQIGAFLDSFAINLIYVFLCVVGVYTVWSIMDFRRRRQRDGKLLLSRAVEVLGTTEKPDNQP